MKQSRNALRILIVAFTVAACLMPASATNIQQSEQEIADTQIQSFLLQKDLCTEKLNEVAHAEPNETTSVSLFNGTQITTETRELQVTDKLKIVNTRTFSVNADMYTATDSYGLFWGGIAGAGGTLEAYYDYSYPVIDNPNQMQTQIHLAGGNAIDLDDSSYDLVGTRPQWDPYPSYNPSASVTFLMETAVGYPPFVVWQELEYVHTCDFDKYGVPRMSWFS